MRVAPVSRHSTTRQLVDGFELTIPAKRNILLILFLTAWLGGWVVGEVSVIRQLLFGRHSAPEFFLAFWLLAWTVGGAFAIYVWAWMAVGKEIVSLRSGTLVIKRDIAGFGRSREYELPHVKSLRVSAAVSDQFSAGMRFWGVGGGLVAFDYGATTIRFAAGVDEAEASMIVTDLKSRHTFRETAA